MEQLKVKRAALASIVALVFAALLCVGASASTAYADTPTNGSASQAASALSNGANSDDALAASGTWKKSSGKWWYSYSDDGTYATGWKQIDNATYYFDSKGWMKTGWQKISGSWRYFKSSGVMTTSWQKVKGAWYFLGDDGVMQTGWLDKGGKWYYLDKSGKMAAGWKKIGGSWYYFNKSGAMQTGWQKLTGKWYYLNGSGKMLTGWQEIDGDWYYLNGSGVMQKSKWIGNYYVQSNGTMATDKWIGRYHVNSSGKWDDTRKASTSVATTVTYASGSKVYHTHNCRSAARIKNPLHCTEAQAMAKGLTLCKNCA